MKPVEPERIQPEWVNPADPAARWLADGFVQHLARWARKSHPCGSTAQEPGASPLDGALIDGSLHAESVSSESVSSESFSSELMSDDLTGRGLAEDPLDRSVRHAHHLPREVAECARRLSLATSAGHVCLPLGLIADEPESLAQTLLDCGLATHDPLKTVAPLVIGAQHRLYLNRYFELEQRLARRIQSALQPASQRFDVDQEKRSQVIGSLALWFGTQADDLEHEQFSAARRALTERLVIISGGPGTGKTTTLVNLLAGLLMMKPDARIGLTAPTGKAAARMLEALAQRASEMPQHIQDLLPGQSCTVHRLIGIRPKAALPTYHAQAPLPLDVVVVDEASMLDLSLATQLLEAIAQDARIILLGDKDQLAAVEAGAVFAELTRLHTELPRNIVGFRRSYRFAPDSAIAALADAVRAGDPHAALSCLKRPSDDLRWIEVQTANAPTPIDLHNAISRGFSEYLQALQQFRATDPQSIVELDQALQRFRVLCTVRQGPLGVERINQRISAWLQQHAQCQARAKDPDPWYPGRVVMVTRNDASTGLFNGDVGIALPDSSDRLRVHFVQAPNPPSIRILPVERLPAHETAFALTVHKAQGSEFEQILLVLAEPTSPVLTRELLYTGITRARSTVMLVASAESITAAISKPTVRYSGLADSIQSLSNRHSVEST